MKTLVLEIPALFVFSSIRAVSALEQSKEKVEMLLKGEELRLTFHGIGQFNNQVLYIKITESAQELLCRIAGTA